jgi:hypothetical protein
MLSDEHDRQAGSTAASLAEGGCYLRDATTKIGGRCFPVDDPSGRAPM